MLRAIYADKHYRKNAVEVLFLIAVVFPSNLLLSVIMALLLTILNECYVM